jgi:hypothetical protein
MADSVAKVGDPDRRRNLQSGADQFLNLSASPAAMHESILRAEGVEKTFATVSARLGRI